MKILCPVDFSKSSVNAARWAASFLHATGGGQLGLIHCMNIRGRSEMFLRVDDIFLETAKNDIDTLSISLEKEFSGLPCSNTIVKSDPKSYIAKHALNKAYDLIVTGTKGLSALKEVSIGSVTESLIKKSDIPILVIPHGYTYKAVKKITLSVDSQAVWEEKTLAALLKIARRASSHIDLVHVRESSEELIEYDSRLERYLENLPWKFHSIPSSNSLLNTIRDFNKEHGSDLLSMIHRKKGFFEGLFTESITKLELFRLELPFLVLVSV